MLGTKIFDESLKESKYGSVDGVGLLDIKTSFGKVDKIVTQSQGELLGNGIFKPFKGTLVNGYELHEGTTILNDVKPLFRIIKGCGNYPGSGFDGAVDGYVAGTYFHGVFHNFYFRRFLTDYLRRNSGLDELGFSRDDFEDIKQFSIDRLADIFENNIEMSYIEDFIER
jgi:adenosylcobyric acid synthase